MRGVAERAEPHAPAPVARVGCDAHQSLALEPGDEPGEVAGVEIEALAQRPEGRPVRLPDLEEEPRDVQRAPGPQVGLLQHADPLRVGAIEPPDRGDERHIL